MSASAAKRYIGTLHPKLGPLILMLFEMEKDIINFVVIGSVFVFGFAAALVPMFALEPSHILSTYHGALIQTLLGVLGLQVRDFRPAVCVCVCSVCVCSVCMLCVCVCVCCVCAACVLRVLCVCVWWGARV